MAPPPPSIHYLTCSLTQHWCCGLCLLGPAELSFILETFHLSSKRLLHLGLCWPQRMRIDLCNSTNHRVSFFHPPCHEDVYLTWAWICLGGEWNLVFLSFFWLFKATLWIWFGCFPPTNLILPHDHAITVKQNIKNKFNPREMSSSSNWQDHAHWETLIGKILAVLVHVSWIHLSELAGNQT